MSSFEYILKKDTFNIKDLAKIIKRETQTIRVWEKKGIILEADMRGENNWRLYSKNRLIEVLEQILNYEWKRQVIKNTVEVYHLIEELKKQQ